MKQKTIYEDKIKSNKIKRAKMVIETLMVQYSISAAEKACLCGLYQQSADIFW